jgi:hypothetical protein
VIVDLSGSPIVAHAGYDFVYFERYASAVPGIYMDSVVVEVCGDPACATSHVVFNWNDWALDANTNIGAAGYGALGEPDNSPIPESALYGTSPLKVGITIDVDAMAPPGTYNYLRLSAPPAGGPGAVTDGAEVDSIEILPAPATATPTASDTPTPTATNTPTATATATATATPTDTATATATFTPSPTATATDTATPTPTPTNTATPTPTVRIAGTVFEDFNYGGGAGRDRLSGAGSSRPSARVELYDAGGSFLAFTTTDALGAYAFPGLAPGSYSVRVVNASVSSSRAGYVPGLLAVQTFRTDAASGLALPVTNRVGGENPALADAGDGATTLAALTTATTTAQSVTPVTLAAVDVTGVDFGLSFNVVVSVRDAGQGSLRQFLTNANALANPGLAQAGRTAGIDNAVFEIPGPGPHTIAVTTWLPSITDPIALDGTSQPGFAGTPIIELNGSATTYDGVQAGFKVLAGNSTIKGLVINRFAVDGIRLESGSNNVVEGNYIGTDISGLLDRGNAFDGVFIVGGSSGNRVGGLLPGQGNLISGNDDEGLDLRAGSANRIQGNLIGIAADGTTALGNVSDGVQITGGTGNELTGNRIAANGGLGIDLLDNGVTPNDGATTAGQPNLLMDYPVFSSATLAGNTLTAAGYVGMAPNDTDFANARVEIFQSDNDPTGFGEGQVYLGLLTTDANGNFFGALDVTGKGLVVGNNLTGTATDAAGNTSEFGANFLVSTPIVISGQVFEDRNYSGGNGTAFGAGDVGLANVRVEAYDTANTFVGFANTVAGGAYSLPVGAPGDYAVRVVSSTIGDADTPPASGYNVGFSGAIVEQTYERDGVTGNGSDGALGGNVPLVDDTTTAAGAGPGDVNVAVTLAGANLANVNFGFTFNLIVNTLDSGQGSLRRFLLNANAIAGTNEAQFNIPLTDPNYSTFILNGFLIRPLTALPLITGEGTLLDGQTQEANQGNRRSGRPDVVLDGINLGSNDSGLILRANESTIAGLDIRRFNNGQASDNGTGIVVDGSTGYGDNNTIADNYLTLNSATDGMTGAVALESQADNNLLSNNTLEVNFGDGIRFADSGNTGNVITGNSILNNGDDGARLYGDTITFDNNTIRLSQQVSASACGLELKSVTNSTISYNLIENNGNQGGICLVDAASTDNTIGPFNTIRNHAGPGIYSLVAGNVRNRFTRNSLSGNAGLGIDLDRDGVTPNDAGDTDVGPNDLLNFPEISGVTISLGQVVITGETRPGATVEFFVVAADPTGYGEGVNFLGSGIEGSGSDSNPGLGSIDPTANQFTFSLPIGVLTCGDTITATATDPSGSTSEFSLNFITPYCSLHFDGNNDIVPTINLPFLTSFTVEAWVYRSADSAGQETFVSDADSGDIAADFSLYVDNNDTDCAGGPADEFAFRQRQPDDQLCSGVDATLNTWFHVAVSRNATDTVRLFVNGALVNFKAMVDPANSSGVFTFGRAGDFNGQYFPGYIAEVRLGSTALYTAAFTPPTAPLSAGAGVAGLWHMDEGSGQFALDSSGTLRHGTLGSTSAAETNDPLWSSEHPY